MKKKKPIPPPTKVIKEGFPPPNYAHNIGASNYIGCGVLMFGFFFLIILIAIGVHY